MFYLRNFEDTFRNPIQKEGPKLINKEYNSDNTKQLNKEELKKLLLSLEYVQHELKSN